MNRQITKKLNKNNSGITLAELLISAFILVSAFAGILVTYIRCVELNEMAHNSSTAIVAAKSRMELIRNTAFADMISTYNQTTFLNSGVDNLLMGDVRAVSYVEQEGTNLKLYRITVAVCWRQKNGRIIGEDVNLNGVLDAGEDQATNPYSIAGKLDSPITIVSYVYDI